MATLEEPDECEGCGETNFSPNWLPEGQCYCDECAANYWQEDSLEDDYWEEEE